jgi:hypothetical protein
MKNSNERGKTDEIIHNQEPPTLFTSLNFLDEVVNFPSQYFLLKLSRKKNDSKTFISNLDSEFNFPSTFLQTMKNYVVKTKETKRLLTVFIETPFI